MDEFNLEIVFANYFANKVIINLHMLAAAMKNGICSKIDRRDIVIEESNGNLYKTPKSSKC